MLAQGDLRCLELLPVGMEYDDLVRGLKRPRKRTVAQAMEAADREGTVLIQPRSGVGGHLAMLEVLRDIHTASRPDMLSLTIDSYTRLGLFEQARSLLLEDAGSHNGYPLVAHGWEKVRELDQAFPVPLQVRHGSPDGRRLFAESLAGGLSSFEGGAIGYNIPYCRNVPLRTSLEAWRDIDQLAGALASDGVVVEREMFGSLTGVLVPPSIALACVLLEAVLAVEQGCTSVSLSIPQGGNVVQDVAALQVARHLCATYLPCSVNAHVVLHQFMGVFPLDRERADALIFTGGLVAALGRATKVITKTYQEAHGRPDAIANAAGVRLTRAAIANPYAITMRGGEEVSEEAEQILSEVREIVDPMLQGAELVEQIINAFETGRLDVPFPASRAARGEVVPIRDRSGAIRFARTGRLPFSAKVMERARRGIDTTAAVQSVAKKVRESILYFA